MLLFFCFFIYRVNFWTAVPKFPKFSIHVYIYQTTLNEREAPIGTILETRGRLFKALILII